MDLLDRITKHTMNTSAPESTGCSTSGNGGRIYRASTNGFKRGKKKDFGRGKGKEVCGWEVFVLWWV
jgi:hypothetical protein